MNVANSVPSLKKILDILRANLIEHGAESYVSEYMEAHYVMCDTASGKGARAQMVLTLFDACSGKSNKTLIFSKIIRRFESDTESALHEIEKTLRSAIDKFTSDIELQIESVGQSNESIEVLHKYPEMKDDLTGAIEMATEQMEKNEQLAQRARQTAKQCGYLD
ncbi:hypothetical protein UCRPC4_g04481 [Phaeomoniella chlamydospora]|uniref:Uncharacterized protein n=1 Tax=Phaeomoniella chlamydospora TaxID=158046 RepID=A0A0G2G6Z1_PHACM|nr:hypothetical protein UCRPC4_g04481 [Phaeomoniella chlamydospora]